MGHLAGGGSRMDLGGDEPGAAGFPAVVGMSGRSQFVASWHRGSDDDLVQVSASP